MARNREASRHVPALVCLVLFLQTVNASVSSFGCADGTREYFTDVEAFPRIAACSATWSVPGVAPTVGATCDHRAGNSVDGQPSGCSVLDACAPGWHICTGPKEVDALSFAGQCALPDALYLTQATNALGSSCDESFGAQNVRACGASSNRLPGDSCHSASAGIGLDSISFPWAIRGAPYDLAKTLVKRPDPQGNNNGGVMCCLNAGPAVLGVFPKTGSTEGGARITITGVDLGVSPDDITSVTVGGSPCIDVKWISPEKIVCTTTEHNQTSALSNAGGAGASGDGQNGAQLPGQVNAGSSIIVTTKSGGQGLGVTTGDFTYISPGDEAVAAATGGVSITGIKPSVINPAGGTVVIIKGTGFNSTSLADITVDISGVECLNLERTPEGYLQCTVPPLPDSVTTGGAEPKITVSVNGRGSASSQEPIRLLEEGEKECVGGCDFTSECDSTLGQCTCRTGWVGSSCSKPAITQSPLSTKFVSELGGTATFEVGVTVKPTSPVKITYRPSLDSEAIVTPSQVVITPGNWEKQQTIVVTGIDDGKCDGARAFALVRTVVSDDSRFADAPSTTNDPLVLTNKEAAGVILNIFPATVGMTGDRVYIIAQNICVEPVFEIDGVKYRPIKRSRFSVIKARIVGGQNLNVARNQLLMLENTTVPATTASAPATTDDGLLPLGQEEFTILLRNVTTREGYRTVTLEPDVAGLGAGISSDGTSLVAPATTQDGIYLTDKCPEDGWFGTGASCRPCPDGAVCPGGSRAWPTEGHWTPDEESGEILDCPMANSCIGGPESLCATGYEGDRCGKCIYGYYEESKQCIACPTSADATMYLICDIILWTSFALCGIFIKHQMLFSYIVMLVKALQSLASVGQMGTERLPNWLQQVYSFLHLFSGDYSFLKPDCYAPTTVEEKFYNGLVYNIVIFLPLLFGVPLAGLIAKMWHAARGTERADVQHKMDWFKDRTVRCFIIFLSTVYLPTTTRAVAMLSCQETETGHYLIIEPSHKCYETGAYWQALAIACFIIILLAMSYPLTMIAYLNKNKDRMLDDRFGERFNFLYEFYKPGFTTFWAIEFAISCLLACANSILVPHPKYQLSLCTVVFGLKLLFILWKGPFLDWITNSIQALLTVALMLAVNANYLLSLDLAQRVTVLRQVVPLFVVIIAGLTIIGLVGIILWVVFRAPPPDEELYDSDGELKKEAFDFGVAASYDESTDGSTENGDLGVVEESIFNRLASFLPQSEHNPLRHRVSAFFDTIFSPSEMGAETGSQEGDDDVELDDMSPEIYDDEVDRLETTIIHRATSEADFSTYPMHEGEDLDDADNYGDGTAGDNDQYMLDVGMSAASLVSPEWEEEGDADHDDVQMEWPNGELVQTRSLPPLERDPDADYM